MCFPSAPPNFLAQCCHNLDSKDLGVWDLGVKYDRSSYEDLTITSPTICSDKLLMLANNNNIARGMKCKYLFKISFLSEIMVGGISNIPIGYVHIYYAHHIPTHITYV